MDDSHSVGITFNVPLFEGGRNVSDTLASRAQYEDQYQFARSARDAMIETLGEDWAAFRGAWELVAVRKSFLEAGRLRAEIVRTQYTNGLVDFDEFDQAEQELVTAERNYVQSLADVLTQEAGWRQSKGETLEHALDAQ
jgi:outer membrane protein TolC